MAHRYVRPVSLTIATLMVLAGCQTPVQTGKPITALGTETTGQAAVGKASLKLRVRPAATQAAAKRYGLKAV